MSVVELCGLKLAHPIINGSGTFDAIAARRAFGEALDGEFPFAAFVSKTITLAPARGQSAAATVGGIRRAWSTRSACPTRASTGYLAEDLPELARRLPVPLVTNVMGSTAAEIARLVAGVRRARGDRGGRAERVVPKRADGPGHRRRSGPAGRGCARGAPEHEQAADREADAERRRRVGVRAGGAGGRRRRGVADQHAASDGARAGSCTARAVAGRRHRWPLRARRFASSRSRRSPRGGARGASP